MIHQTIKESESLLDVYTRGEAEMARLSHGEVLDRVADAVVAGLPSGPLRLVSTSIQGAGLAAVCAARRADATQWQFLELPLLPDADDSPMVVIEPLDPGPGWKASVERTLPGVGFVFADAALARPSVAA